MKKIFLEIFWYFNVKEFLGLLHFFEKKIIPSLFSYFFFYFLWVTSQNFNILTRPQNIFFLIHVTQVHSSHNSFHFQFELHSKVFKIISEKKTWNIFSKRKWKLVGQLSIFVIFRVAVMLTGYEIIWREFWSWMSGFRNVVYKNFKQFFFGYAVRKNSENIF